MKLVCQRGPFFQGSFDGYAIHANRLINEQGETVWRIRSSRTVGATHVHDYLIVQHCFHHVLEHHEENAEHHFDISEETYPPHSLEREAILQAIAIWAPPEAAHAPGTF